MAETIFGLTTEDNPFDVFDEFEKWRIFDQQKRYFTDSYLARIAKPYEEMTNEQFNKEIERAIDEIIALNKTKDGSKQTIQYKKVSKVVS